jgi:integrase
MHAAKNNRLSSTPRIEPLAARYRSKARDRLLTIEQLGMIYWYCRQRPELFPIFALMLGTGGRPEAMAKFDPLRQYNPRTGLIDTQHPDAPLTNKRNQIIPAIRPLRTVLSAWSIAGAKPVKSHKTAWRTMRRTLELPADVVAKDIRHTIATELYQNPKVPERQVSELLGHAGNLERTTKVYAKYRPDRLEGAVRALSELWLAVSREAKRFGADHSLSNGDRRGKLVVMPRGDKT